MSLSDLFRNFFAVSTENRYPSSAKLLYFTLLGEFNRNFWEKSELSFSDRELSGLTGLDHTTVCKARKFLADRGHIKTFRPKRTTGATIYQITGKSPQNHHNVTTAITTAITTARGNSLSPIPTLSQDIKTNKTDDDDDARAIRGIDKDILNEWRDNVGNPGNAELNFLHQWSRIYGKEAVIDAIHEAAAGNRYPRISINYVKKILENKQKRGFKYESNSTKNLGKSGSAANRTPETPQELSLQRKRLEDERKHNRRKF